KDLQDSDIIKLIQKLAKQRKESADQYVAAGRKDLADNEMVEAAILEKYLPAQLTPEEVEAQLRQIIEEVGAKSEADMVKVMGAATKKLAGLSDGKTISTIVKQLLS
ncbi:MAG: GatB/YqeY domain-containing protein, partial [Bacteroidales bacterium]|nr:GatB/YqeY domain-containing protein [Bacteroidales bacterium]